MQVGIHSSPKWLEMSISEAKLYFENFWWHLAKYSLESIAKLFERKTFLIFPHFLEFLDFSCQTVTFRPILVVYVPTFVYLVKGHAPKAFRIASSRANLLKLNARHLYNSLLDSRA